MMRLFFLLITGFSVLLVKAQRQIEIRYLGNMGIAVVQNDSSIIIDGIHDFYEIDYLPADTSAIASMMRMQKPFSNIIAIAITHRHSDHFDENLVSSVVKKHPRALVISGGQTKALLDAETQKRMDQVVGAATFLIGNNLLINVKQVPHTYPGRHSSIENYRIDIVWNGFHIVHLGDADTKKEVVAGLTSNPDVMVVPSWYLFDGGELIEQVRPEKLIVTHISPGDTKIRKNESLSMKQVLFQKYGDKINFSK